MQRNRNILKKKTLKKRKKNLSIKEIKEVKEIKEINKLKKRRKIKKSKESKEVPVVSVEKLDPLAIPKYVNKLEKPLTFFPHTVKEKVKKNGERRTQIQHHYQIDICQTMQQILPPGFPKTKVYGYGGFVHDPKTNKLIYHVSSPGSTFEAKRGIPVVVKWRNRIKEPHFLAVDPTLHWANPNGMPMDPPKPWPPYPPGFKDAQWPVPTVTHLHGCEVQSDSDGHPEAWFTHDGKHGPAFVSYTYTYPNNQEPATLWYHDHTLGMTRLNVYAGLAGFYLLRDEKASKKKFSEQRLNLPTGDFEIPLIIQDKMFNTDGSLLFINEGTTPEENPYWSPGFFGDVIVVNGKVWPNLDVERRQYRFRILNGSNSRFYNLSFSNGMKFTQIGSDGGLLKYPAELQSLLLAPGERADILVDFSGIEPGTKILLLNNAPAPYPFGAPPDPESVGQIMQFTVPLDAAKPVKPKELPKVLNYIPTLYEDVPRRILTVNDIAAPSGIPTMMLLNGQLWSDTVTETPIVGSTEDWYIVSLTA
ncbi:MAG TPA: multicopper oxidase domain-containing protein, partial [Mobilitalea sp.]|nr:multicopper oxidase domain-containing protein [Mobilitalea sp.]